MWRMKNEISDEAKRMGRRRTQLHDIRSYCSGDVDELIGNHDTEREADTLERAEWLREHVALLPERQRVVLELVLDGVGQTEIGETVGIATGTTGAHIHRARERLAEMWNARPE